MKKNISINISGIIFHIEEDGYERLKEYLDTINKYFSTFEDSSEIIADIESRIAEIFLAKLKEGSRQVVTAEDVEGLVGTMGTVADFQAVEEEPETKKEEKAEPREEAQSEESSEEKPKKLYRDMKRRVFGGVAAGIAHYFSIDPLWIRLIMIIVFFNIFVGFGLSGLLLLAYIIMWVALPGSDTLPEDKKIKKMYRNSDDKVLGGVASGIAVYFGADKTLIRVLFVISIFLGGSGLIIYIILWIITDEAKSITEKMEMQGEEVTLSNIDHSVKDRMAVKETQEENILVKILLFPFRLIALIFKGLGVILGPAMKFLLEALRVLVAIVLIVLGLALISALILLTLVFLGIFTGMEAWIHIQDLPLDVFQDALPNGTIFFVFIAAFIPALAIGLLGFTILFKTRVTNTYVRSALFGVWLIALIGASITLPRAFADFRRGGEVTVTTDYDLNGKSAVLNLREVDIRDYSGASLTLRGHSDSVFTLVQDFEARGSNLETARENAQTVEYTVTQSDSVIRFDSNITFKPDAKFRFQEVNMVLYIPQGQVFYMDENLEDILRNTIYRAGYSVYDIPDNQWMFTEDGLECITCENSNNYSYGDEQEDGQSDVVDSSEYEGEQLSFDFDNFDEIVASDRFDFTITPGNDYEVKLFGKDSDLDRVRLEQKGDVLEFEMRNRRVLRDRLKRPIKVVLTMPELQRIKMRGACSVKASGFDGETLEVDMTGSSDAELSVNMEEIYVEMTGSSDLLITGKVEDLEADLSGTASLLALDLEAAKAEVETSGASSAKVYVIRDFTARSGGVSNIHYQGDPELDLDEGGASSIKRLRD